jgi:O-antigen/teichoic acid export membrane protein
MRYAQRLLDALPQGEFFRGALTIASGTGAAQLIAILSSPIVTRLYDPAAYGAFAATASLLSILISIACLRYELAIPLPKSDTAAANVLALALLVAATVSLVMVPIMWLAGPTILTIAGASALSPYVLLLPVGVLGGGAVSALTGWMIRTKTYSEIAANRLAQTGTVAVAQIGLGVLGAGAVGLLVGSVAGNFAGLSRLARAAWRTRSESFRAVTRADIAATATRYRRFPIFSAPSAFLTMLGVEAPLLLIVALYGAGVGGQFALAQRIVALPVGLVAAAVGQVYFAEAARRNRELPAELRTLFWKTSRTLAIIAIGPFALAALTAPLLFGPIFGHNWSEAGVYVAILAPMYFLQFVTWPTGGTLDVLERQDLHLVREIARTALVGGAVVGASALHASPIGVVVAVSVSGCLTNALYGFVSWRAIVGRRQARADVPLSGVGRIDEQPDDSDAYPGHE